MGEMDEEEEREERVDLEMEMMEEREDMAEMEEEREELAEEQERIDRECYARREHQTRPAPSRWGSSGTRYDEECDHCHRETQVDNDTGMCRRCGS